MKVDNKDQINKNLIESWKKLQSNGETLYHKFPELNCAYGTRHDVEIFKKFCSLRGKVLDVGCGPRAPSYFEENESIQLGIGIDPLVSSSNEQLNENIHLMRAVGEYLPFQDEYFDSVCFATSFDHVLDHTKVLKETKRVLKKDAIAIFWVGDEPSKRSSIKNRIKRKMRRIIFEKREKQKLEELQKIIESQEKIVASMEVPSGAVDKFHMKHINYNEFCDLCMSLGFKKLAEKSIEGSVFIKYGKK